MTSIRRSRPSRAAYTLVEMLIVIGILGIAGALLVPQIVSRDDLALQAAARLLIADLSFAQSDALAHQEYRRVHFYDDGSGYCIVRLTQAELDDDFDPDTADYIDDPLAVAGALGRYVVRYTTDTRFEGISITDVDLDDGARFATYDELGGTIDEAGDPGVGGTITITSDVGDSFVITVSAFTGRLTIARLVADEDEGG
ncbi:MAG: type II secretion system protein [Phycisphaerales bacterium]|nr:type II secretion system protein [Phycisphaerales bacterium]